MPMLANDWPIERQARDKIAAARVWLLKHKPFFGVLARAFRLEPAAVPGYRLWSDDRLQFNPGAVLAARFSALCARLSHLALHAALGAFARRHGREERRWNVACDLAIAPLLEAADLSVGRAPPIAEVAALPAGTSAEAFFSALPQGILPDPLWCDLCDPPGGEGCDVAQSTIASMYQHSPIEAQDRELAWKMRLAAAYEEEIAAGSPSFEQMPGWIDELLRATIEPPAHWSAVLQRSIHLLARFSRSYLRPSRRISALCGDGGAWPEVVTMPGRRVAHAGRLCAVVDTSASLPSGTLARFFGALAAAASAEGIDELRLLQADAAVTRDEVVFAAELLFREIAVSGRGGTNFAPALDLLAREAQAAGERFTVAYLTDLAGSFPPAELAAPLDVLWVSPGAIREAPPFGRVIAMAPADR